MIVRVTGTDVFKQAIRLVGKDWNLLNRLIYESLRSDVPLVGRVAQYLLSSGGKRIRPMLLMLAARALGCPPGGPQVRAGVIVEYIHSATLLHDDVVDEAELRRGKTAANVLHGPAASVLVGDFLYSRAFELIVKTLKKDRAVEVLAATTNRIAEGEVLQLMNLKQAAVTEQQYLEVIRRKTASLFQACAQIGAILADADPAFEKAATTYGLELGMAYQITDDVLDYSGGASAFGKSVGADLKEGKTTLPIIYAMHAGSPYQQAALRNALRTGGLDNLPEVMEAIESTGALQYAAKRAGEAAGRAVDALAGLPDSKFRDLLESLARFSAQRAF
ncbi:MAG: polyprenyl synthetase family protein [Gammaproteobacteria bacterium]|nr:polyprenyl synthetase family protein [Gammaproteobacteria bacterium]MCY4339792.1 polyprenyl synthetase family protein [Gammaproteobacteria bacterium]